MTEPVKIPEFKLHSKGENWFHFRADPDSICRSFTVTYIHDGTVVMSGDYGMLAWRRRAFPENIDYGFPAEGTNIGYFAEKVHQAENIQRIKTWDPEQAEKEIREHFEELIADAEEEGEKAELRTFLENMDISDDYSSPEMSVVGEAKMYDQLNELNSQGDWGEHHFGERLTETFEFQFQCLISVSKMIREEVYKDAE